MMKCKKCKAELVDGSCPIQTATPEHLDYVHNSIDSFWIYLVILLALWISVIVLIFINR